MQADMRAIEGFLKDYAERIEASLGKMVLGLEGRPEPTSPEEAKALEREMETLRDWIAYHAEVEAEWLALVRDRTGDPVELFAGSWPPINPLDIEAMATTLGRDYDELSGSNYLSEDEDFGAGGGPVSDAWLEMHALELALKPTSMEAATAIVRAADRDAKLGCGDEWNERRVRRARKVGAEVRGWRYPSQSKKA